MVIEPVPKLRLSSFLMIRDAAVAGAGAALMPQSIAWNQLTCGQLVQWGTVSDVEVGLWVLHTSRRLQRRSDEPMKSAACCRAAGVRTPAVND